MPLRWAWVLGFALLAPVALPAGGAELRVPDPRRRGSAGPLLASAGEDGTRWPALGLCTGVVRQRFWHGTSP